MSNPTVQASANVATTSTLRELTSSIDFSYLKNGSWKSFNGKVLTSVDGIKIQTSSNYYLQYRTQNQGQSDFYPYVTSKENDYAGLSGQPVQLLDIRAYDSNGTKLSSGIVVMYRVFVEKWLPWVSNADPEYMRIIQNKYGLIGTLDTSAFYAGIEGRNVTGIEIRVFEEDYSTGNEDYTNGEIVPRLRYMVGNTWRPFTKSILSSPIDGIEIHTNSSKPYYLSYQTFHEGESTYYPAVSSTDNDYAGYPNKPIQKLSIEVIGTDGNKLGSGVIVMYRTMLDGEWLPWVSNADPEWMRRVQSKYSLGGTLDTSSAYAGITGKNIEGVEIRIFEDTSSAPSSGDFDGSEVSLTSSYMKDSESNWKSFSKTIMTGDYIDGIKLQTSSSDSFYLSYQTFNEGQSDYFPEVTSRQNDYAGNPGQHIQKLIINAYDNNGTKLTTDVVVMYRVYVGSGWLPWVSNADPEWMRSVQSQYNLGGSLDTSAAFAGIQGTNIKGVEIRVFTGHTVSGSIEGLTGSEVSPSSLRYLVGNTWHSFNKSVTADRIDGIEIKTSPNKPYYISYQTQNEGRSYFYPPVSSIEDDYAGYPNIPVQALGLCVYTNTGTKLSSGVVVMWRTKTGGRWLPWVSNADPEWMRSVQRKYGLDGALDTGSYSAGIIGQNIEGVEIRIFEETEIYNGTQTPTGDYKIIDVPFISQVGTYPTGCESVTAVMALRHIGNNTSVDSFIDNYLDKQGFPFDPNAAFGGNPRSNSGFGCYAPVIKKALNRILSGSEYSATQLSGASLQSLCSQYIDNDIPVIMWATMYMNTAYISSVWTYNGKIIQWVAPEHCLLLVGYDEKNYIFNDPLLHKQTYYNKSAVEEAYAALSQQAIVIQKTKRNYQHLADIDRQVLYTSYNYSEYYNANHNELADAHIPSNLNDFTVLSCLELLFTYYYTIKDYEKADMLYDEIITLRKLQPSYRTYYSDFLDANGEFDIGYQYYAPGRKTTKFQVISASYFTADAIHQLHNADDFVIALSALIPGVGRFLSILLSTMKGLEQEGLIGLGEAIIPGIGDAAAGHMIDKIIDLWQGPLSLKMVINLLDFAFNEYEIATDDRATYIRDGVVIQEGDAYMDVRLNYDLGVEYHSFRFYFRNGYPYVTNLEQFTVRWDNDHRGVGVMKANIAEFQAEGYVPSEKHEPRGPYWPEDL